MRHALEGWLRDVTQAFRSLRRAPGFTGVTVATLALSIGATAAIFSVVDAVLLDPLPFPDSDRLVSVRATAPGSDLTGEFGVSDEMYVHYREQVGALQDAGLFSGVQTTMRTDERVERLFMSRVTPSFFTTLGVAPVAGRLPGPDDDENVAVISHWLWTSWFGADPAVVGQAYEMAGEMRTVIGVMGPDFTFPDIRGAAWVNTPIDEAGLTPGGFNWNLVGRLAPGADHDVLAAQLAPVAQRLPEQMGGPPQYAEIMERHRPVVRSLEEQVVGGIAGPLWVIFATMGIVLLIACANVANLFIARGESRRHDLAIRRAVGAGRRGLVRCQMAEALALAGLGGAAGIFLAWIALPLLVRAAPENVPGLENAAVGPGTLLFTVGISVLAACAFGLLPAIRLSQPALEGGLGQRGSGRTDMGGARASVGWGGVGRGGVGRGRARAGRGRRGRDALVVVQTASALVLLIGSALLVQSFWKLSQVDPGYDVDDIFTFQIAPAGEDLDSSTAYALFHQEFMERLSGLPGVRSVGVVEMLPLDEGARTARFATEQTEVSGEDGPVLSVTFTGGDYFRTMGIDLLDGRTFEPIDEGTGMLNAIVSRSAADRLWPDEPPLGQRLRPLAIQTDEWWTVVGVVEDVMLNDFREAAPQPLVYLPLVGAGPNDGWTVGSPAYVVRSPRAEFMAADVRELARQVAPDAPVYRIFTMRGLAARSMAQLTFTMYALAVAAGLALILAAIGLYGVLSYVVSQRSGEIALRMALGAEGPEVRRMIVLQGTRVALVGVVLGLLAAMALTRVLGSMLFGVGTLDVLTLVAIPAVMLAVALLASYIPALRASSVDPIAALKAD